MTAYFHLRLSLLLTFEQARSLLPEPIFDSRQDYIECYWRTWEIAYSNTHVPAPESGFVSNFVDAAFNDKIFLWDTAFITMFCNLGHPYIPGIRSLDNFYCKQLDDGEIAREYVTKTGIEFYKWVNTERKPLHSFFHNHYKYRGLSEFNDLDFEVMFKSDLGRTVENPPYFRLDNLNHPILSWVELESFKHTGTGIVWSWYGNHWCAITELCAITFQSLWIVCNRLGQHG